MPQLKRIYSESQKIIHSSSLLFFTRMSGALIAFVIQVVIARFFGAIELGHYLVMLALANIIANLIPQGYQMTGAFFVATYRFASEKAQLHGFLIDAYRRVLIASGVCLSLGILVYFSGSAFFPHVQFRLLTFAIFLAPAMALIFLNSNVLIGFQRPLIGILPDMILRPVTLLLVVSILALGAHSRIIDHFFWSAVAIIWLIAIGHLIVVDRILPIFPTSRPEPKIKEAQRWRRFALPWLLIALITEFVLDLDILFLSLLFAPDELAIFGVCLRLFALLGFAVNAIYMIILPQMFSSAIHKDQFLFQEQLNRANILATLTACLCLLMVIFLGDPVLNIFGSDFLVGRPVLILLMIALIFRTIFGPAHVVLSLHDYPYAALPILFIGLGILVISNLLLIPFYGLLGGACALTLSYTFWAIFLWRLTLINTGKDISLFATLKGQ